MPAMLLINRYFYNIIILCSVTVLFENVEAENFKEIDIKPDGKSKLITLPGKDLLIIKASDIPINASAIVFQAHSHISNLTMSDQKEALIHQRVIGRNVGMLIKLHESNLDKRIWLSHQGSESITVLLMLHALKSDEPFPGDCNMEFPTESAPYLRLKSDTLHYLLEYQHARLGSPKNKPLFTCSFSSIYLSYDVYISFLEENNFSEDNYFKGIELMTNVSSIKQISTEAHSFNQHPDTRYIFVKYPNIGVVYNIVAKYTINCQVKEIAYVPISSYGCANFSENGCSFSYSMEGKFLLFFLSIYGFIVAFFGYLYVGPVIFYYGLLASFFISLIFVGKYGNFTLRTTVMMSIGLGMIGAIIPFFLWLWLHNILVLLMLNGLMFGFLISATVLYTPIGNFSVFHSGLNFWAILLTGTIVTALIALMCPNMMTILGCSIVGSYTLVLFYDDFIGTRLSYIILNIIKKAVSEKRDFAFNDFPFQIRDIIMTVLWIVLSMLAVAIWLKKLSQDSRRSCNLRCFVHRSTRAYQQLLYTNTNIEPTSQPLLTENRNTYYQTF